MVKVQRAHKIRLNPSSEQEQRLLQTCGVARFCFNWGLERWQRQYAAGEKTSGYGLKKQFNSIRREQFPWTYDTSKCAVDSGFRNLDAAFKNFFRRCKNGGAKKGYPKFKSKKRAKASFQMDGARVKLNENWIKIEKMEEQINMTESLRLDGEIKSITVSKDGEYWHVAINVEMEILEHEHPCESTGIDVGIKTLAVLSDGTEFENQKLLRSELNKLKRFSRELSRRDQGSNRWQHTKHKLARLHRRVANRRLDCQHKMTTEIALTYRIIGVEDLNVAGMLRNRHLALSIADAGFGEIKRQLTYKSQGHNGLLVKIDRFFPSSKLCRFCGAINDDLALSDREWTCVCGAVLDRDLNAAMNIEREALRMFAGVGSRRTKMHVERMLDSQERSAMKRENMAEKRQPSRLAVSLA